MTVRLLYMLSLAALALSACAGTPERGAVTSEGSTQRVVVVPLNVSIRAAAELDGKGEPVWQELLAYLQAQDRHVAVLSRDSAERLWRAARPELDGSDRSRALEEARSRFARGLARYRDYDLMVIPSLVLRPGQLHGRYASWDGVQRSVPQSDGMLSSEYGEVARSAAAAVLGLRGKVAGVSLHVSILRSDGSHVYEGLGGLDLLQEIQRDAQWDGKWSFRTRAEPFSEPNHLREGVERAFARPLLAALH